MAIITRIQPAVIAATASLALAACGGGGTTSPLSTSPSLNVATTAAAPPTTSAAATTAAPTESTAAPTTVAAGIGSFQDVQPAVIQIVAGGSFRSVEDGETYAGYGRGSGFIISDDGIAVTNNHVVTGSATLEVFVGGDTTKSYNATVLGVSECNDLAVIDISEPKPLPSLQWYDGEIKPGLKVYAAGFPLGDPEYTLSSGIVAKADSSGDMPWASIDSTIEHDAATQPGNSGGPLVGEDGKVIAIHYASKRAANLPQFQAIGGGLAQSVVEKLKKGDFESIGINGEAYINEETGISGIWVAGIAPGSPASKLGLAPGDIIQEMNGLPVGTDGTMKAYCDVLRTAGTKPITMRVTRFDTSEVLEGELGNKDRPLTPVFSFASEIDVASTGGSVAISGYETLTDDLGALQVDVPIEWIDRSTAPDKLDDGTPLPVIQASPSLADYNGGWGTPGLTFTRLNAFGVDEALAAFEQSADCTGSDVQSYEDGAYTGGFQVWANCGGTGATVVVVAAISQDWSSTAILMIQANSEADLAVLDAVFASFVVTG